MYAIRNTNQDKTSEPSRWLLVCERSYDTFAKKLEKSSLENAKRQTNQPTHSLSWKWEDRI